MKIKNLIAEMLTVVMLAGPGTMTCYAAGSSEADAVSVQNASRLTHDEVFNTLRGTIHE